MVKDNILDNKLLQVVANAADDIGCPAYVVGGWVRDQQLGIASNDIDFVVEGSGIELATRVAELLNRPGQLNVFKNFGTAMLRHDNWEMEFVGARKESYRSNSRKPVVEDASLEEDLSRRDFTINAMAICLNGSNRGNLIDLFEGQADLEQGLIRTPLEAETTYSDDPLRMMRAIRFSSQLNFRVESGSLEAIEKNAHRIEIVSEERIIDEFNKIILSPNPGKGIKMLRAVGLLKQFFPELTALHGVEVVNGKAHKDNFFHTLQVLDNLSVKSDDLWLRWAALLHDIAKPATKKYDPSLGWTFYGHEHLGAKMVSRIFRRLKLPQNEKMKFVQKMVLLHLRPIALTEEEVTDSAVRRLLFDADDHIDQLMTLCEADITSGNPDKVKRYLSNFEHVRAKLREIEEKDKIRNWQPPVTGDEIMTTFGLKPCREVGVIKTAIREAILDGLIPNDYEHALRFMEEEGRRLGLVLRKKNS